MPENILIDVYFSHIFINIFNPFCLWIVIENFGSPKKPELYGNLSMDGDKSNTNGVSMADISQLNRNHDKISR